MAQNPLHSGSSVVRQIIYEIVRQETLAIRAVAIFDEIKKSKPFQKMRRRKHDMYGYLADMIDVLGDRKGRELQYIEQEIDCFRQNRLLPTDLRERKYKADPQIDQHAENHLKVVGEIFAEIIEQHKEVDFSLKHIDSMLKHKDLAPVNDFLSTLYNWLQSLYDYMLDERALINSDLRNLLAHGLISTDGHDHFLSHVDKLPEDHPGRVFYYEQNLQHGPGGSRTAVPAPVSTAPAPHPLPPIPPPQLSRSASALPFGPPLASSTSHGHAGPSVTPLPPAPSRPRTPGSHPSNSRAPSPDSVFDAVRMQLEQRPPRTPERHGTMHPDAHAKAEAAAKAAANTQRGQRRKQQDREKPKGSGGFWKGLFGGRKTKVG